MNTPARLFLSAVCGLGVAAAVGISMSRSHRTHGDLKSSARVAPTPTGSVHAEHWHNRGSTRVLDQADSIRLELVTADADSDSPDTLEDPDQIRAWARRNPQRAWDWLVSAPEGAKRDAVSEMVCLEIAETNAAAAVMLADVYGACTNVLENLMVQWADRDVEAAYTWAAARPSGEQRNGLLSRIAFVESKTDPKDAATLVAEQIPPGPIQDEAAISVLYQWALKDPEAAMNWAQSISAGTLRDRAINEVQHVMAGSSQSANAL